MLMFVLRSTPIHAPLKSNLGFHLRCRSAHLSGYFKCILFLVSDNSLTHDPWRSLAFYIQVSNVVHGWLWNKPQVQGIMKRNTHTHTHTHTHKVLLYILSISNLMWGIASTTYTKYMSWENNHNCIHNLLFLAIEEVLEDTFIYRMLRVSTCCKNVLWWR
jgi:hypothetical protein